jgi:hypothetical protein
MRRAPGPAGRPFRVRAVICRSRAGHTARAEGGDAPPLEALRAATEDSRAGRSPREVARPLLPRPGPTARTAGRAPAAAMRRRGEKRRILGRLPTFMPGCEASGGLVLMAAAALALLIANSPLVPAYFGALHAYIGPLSLLH